MTRIANIVCDGANLTLEYFEGDEDKAGALFEFCKKAVYENK
jgi:hypothetical protein